MNDSVHPDQTPHFSVSDLVNTVLFWSDCPNIYGKYSKATRMLNSIITEMSSSFHLSMSSSPFWKCQVLFSWKRIFKLNWPLVFNMSYNYEKEPYHIL